MVRNFAEQGWLDLTDGNEIDIAYLSERVFTILQDYDVQYLGYDPWNATGVTQRLQVLGVPEHKLLKMPQTFSTYNEPFKKFLGMLAGGKVHQNGNAVLRWMMSNVAHKEDASGNIRPDKGKSSEKIDGVSATLMALGLAIHYGLESGAYDNAGSGVVMF